MNRMKGMELICFVLCLPLFLIFDFFTFLFTDQSEFLLWLSSLFHKEE